ncbi:MAG: DUF3786 domain-containing protein [Nitrospirales bacterium]|nr:DUF3786 domain-containing protein [Nitrospirales bacterium]
MSAIPGEEKAWEILAGLAPEEVCRRSGAVYLPEEGRYRLSSFGIELLYDTRSREILCPEKGGEIFLARLAYFFRLSALWYLVKAVEAGPSGRLVKPESLPDGDAFFKGSHQLPLDGLAKRFAEDRAGFLEQAKRLGGRPVAYGDAAVELLPFPRIPVTLILWLRDDEWDSRCDLLFDSTASVQVPVDILWSIAMMSVLAFM